MEDQPAPGVFFRQEKLGAKLFFARDAPNIHILAAIFQALQRMTLNIIPIVAGMVVDLEHGIDHRFRRIHALKKLPAVCSVIYGGRKPVLAVRHPDQQFAAGVVLGNEENAPGHEEADRQVRVDIRRPKIVGDIEIVRNPVRFLPADFAKDSMLRQIRIKRSGAFRFIARISKALRAHRESLRVFFQMQFHHKCRHRQQPPFRAENGPKKKKQGITTNASLRTEKKKTGRKAEKAMSKGKKKGKAFLPE